MSQLKPQITNLLVEVHLRITEIGITFTKHIYHLYLECYTCSIKQQQQQQRKLKIMLLNTKHCTNIETNHLKYTTHASITKTIKSIYFSFS